MADIVSPTQEVTLLGREKRNPGVRMGGQTISELGSAHSEDRLARAEEPTLLIEACNSRPVVIDRRPENASSAHRRRSGEALQPCLANGVSGSGAVTPAVMSCPASGGAENPMRAQAVAATMIALPTAIACCQPSAGTAMCATPSAA